MQTIGPVVQILVAVVTAVATIALWYVTRVLARETRRLASATSDPLVVVTIEPSDWSLMHAEQIIENSGNATAFDVKIDFSPELTTSHLSEKGREIWKEIDIIRPGQRFRSMLGDVKEVWDNDYSVNVSWRRDPNKFKRDEIHYKCSLAKFKNKTRLGSVSPEHQIAEEIKNIRNDWRLVSQGIRKLKSDIYSSTDREAESAAFERHRQIEKDMRNREEKNE